ncbi:MAG: SMC-Scp complex subunit ScpB [Verrucomicrobia bacterium Tous-C9LFEB]|nr:MAG: SMC-Scp complex subunit ScpB [Verrucomicrobia bacterium Tous-C9LFEB]
MELKLVIEALLFAAEKPLLVKRIQTMLKDAAGCAPTPETEPFHSLKEEEIRQALTDLDTDYVTRGSGLMVQEIAEGFQIRTRPQYAVWVEQLFDGPKVSRMSQPAVETLAIIAYRQPISRADIEAVRGVAVDGVVATLLERKLIRIAGRSEQPGRPLLYETTPIFLEEFGLKNLNELPNADELRTIELRRANPPETPTAEQPPLFNENPEPAQEDRPVGQPAADAPQPES